MSFFYKFEENIKNCWTISLKGISRQDENFKACLGLELRADDDVEASLRVSCFQFGPRGLATMEAEPLPPNITDEDEDDDDDDDDPLGIGERKHQ